MGKEPKPLKHLDDNDSWRFNRLTSQYLAEGYFKGINVPESRKNRTPEFRGYDINIHASLAKKKECDEENEDWVNKNDPGVLYDPHWRDDWRKSQQVQRDPLDRVSGPA